MKEVEAKRKIEPAIEEVSTYIAILFKSREALNTIASDGEFGTYDEGGFPLLGKDTESIRILKGMAFGGYRVLAMGGLEDVAKCIVKAVDQCQNIQKEASLT